MKLQQNLPDFLSIKIFNKHENHNNSNNNNNNKNRKERSWLGDRKLKQCLLRLQPYHSKYFL